MVQGIVNTIRRLRINTDGSGVRSVVFMQNCPLSCEWCCNPETRLPGQGQKLSPEELYREIECDMPYFLYSGGVTFSGGEPLAQADFLSAFIRTYCRDLSVDIETSLYASREQLDQLMPLISTWYVDFKVFDEQLHWKYTGASNEPIKENLRILSQNVSRDQIIITYPMIPAYNTDIQNIRQMLAFLKELGLRQMKLHPSRSNIQTKYPRCGLPVPQIGELSAEQLDEIRCLITESGFTIVKPDTLFGRKKCAYLKAIRQKICAENELPVPLSECDFQGECIGSCPRCEWELQEIGCYLKMDFEEERHVSVAEKQKIPKEEGCTPNSTN